MASSDKEDFISETSTNCSHTSYVGTMKCNRNVFNENEASYFSASQNFDHSASNFIQHSLLGIIFFEVTIFQHSVNNQISK